jgi:hypothetical protein
MGNKGRRGGEITPVDPAMAACPTALPLGAGDDVLVEAAGGILPRGHARGGRHRHLASRVCPRRLAAPTHVVRAPAPPRVRAHGPKWHSAPRQRSRRGGQACGGRRRWGTEGGWES